MPLVKPIVPLFMMPCLVAVMIRCEQRGRGHGGVCLRGDGGAVVSKL